MQRLADRISAVFAPVVIAVAIMTLAGWLAAGQPAGAAFSAAVAVLIIACPCAMGLATPTALLVGTGRGGQLGILIKGPEVLESTRAVAACAARDEAAGQTVVFAGWDGAVRGVLAVADMIRPTSAEAVRRLDAMGLRPVLLTGDNDRAARAVADAAGIGDVIAGVLPAGKVEAVRRLQQAGRVVAMAGNGVNDAAALAQADLGLAHHRSSWIPWFATSRTSGDLALRLFKLLFLCTRLLRQRCSSGRAAAPRCLAQACGRGSHAAACLSRASASRRASPGVSPVQVPFPAPGEAPMSWLTRWAG